MPENKRHIFVCQNSRPVGGRPACAGRGGSEILASLREAIAARPELWGAISINGCDCLGPCFEGPNAVVYPEGIHYGGLSTADVPELVSSHLVEGIPVARLVRPPTDD